MGKKIIQKLVLGGIILRDKKILIIQRNKSEEVYPNMWELPSGKKEFLEKSEDSLLREIKEETGLDVEVVMPVSVFDYQIEKRTEIRDSTQINFLVEIIGSCKVNLSLEHQNFAWIAENETKRYELSAATKDTIKEAFELVRKLGNEKK